MAKMSAPAAPRRRRRWRSISKSRRQIPTVCSGIAWAISTSCFSRMRLPRPKHCRIVLTKRGKHQGQRHSDVRRADASGRRIFAAAYPQGYRVAVCEQLEDPAEARKRGAKAVVKRDVVRLVTPGTITEEALLDAKARNLSDCGFPCGECATESVLIGQARVALASVDISTGEFEIGEDLGSRSGRRTRPACAGRSHRIRCAAR